MTDIFSINGQRIGSSDFDEAVHLLHEATGQDVTEAAADGEISQQEIVTLLDQNNDGRLRFDDFSSGSAPLVSQTQLFNDLESLLSRHGFDLFSEIDQSISFYFRREIPPIFWSNRNFALRAVQYRGLFLSHVAPELRTDREIVLTAVRDDGTVLEYASDDLRHDREIVLAAVQQTGWALRVTPRELRGDREIVLTAMARNGSTLRFASEELRADPEIVLAAIHQNGNSLEFADPSLQVDPDIVLAAVHQNAEAWQYMDTILLSDPLFLGRLVVANHQMMNFIDPTLQDEVWQNTLSHLRSEGFVFDEAGLPSYDAFLFLLASHEIRFPERFRSLTTALTIINNLDSLGESEDTRPLAVLFYPALDSEGEFAEFPLVDLFMESGLFRVIYYEVSTAQEIEEHFNATIGSAARHDHTLVLAGFGTASAIGIAEETHISADRLNRFQDPHYVDTGDFDRGEMSFFSDQILTGGQVLLYASWAGEGGADQDNLANRFSRLLPGVQIYSNGAAHTISSMRINEDGRLQIEWRVSRPYNLRTE